MPTKIFSTLCGAATLAMGFALLATPAYAGFQWSEPKDQGSSYQSGGQAMPVAAGTPESLISSAPDVARLPAIPDYPNAPSVAAPSHPSSGMTRNTYDLSTETISVPTPPVSSPTEISSLPAFSTSPSSLSSSNEVVQGFASQVPLPLALRQVLPGDYNFSIDPTVDANTLLSYRGGKPWPETLKTMLNTAGLDYQVNGSVVMVTRMSVASAPAKDPTVAQTLRFIQPAPLPIAKAQDQGMAPSMGMGSGTVDSWTAQRGETLHKVLASWCSRAGVELKWLAEYDYPIEASAHFSGGFEDAVRSLFAGFDSARPQPIGELHVNPRAGQDVLVVQARGNSYTN